MYRITITNDRAMGNAYIVYTVVMGKSIVLCDGGIVQLTRALREKCIAYQESEKDYRDKPIKHTVKAEKYNALEKIGAFED